MKITRRNMVLSTLFGAGCAGLRSLATGLPLSFILGPHDALADGMCTAPDKAQFIIFNTSSSGDPINANVPGTYEDPGIYHSPDPTMTPTSLQLGGQSYMAAAPWAGLQNVLDRTVFWHLMTNTPVHPKEPNVLAFNGAIEPAEMFPSLLAKQLAPCLGTIQTQPITLGATSPSEGLSYAGAALPIIPPLALKATLANAAGPLTNLQALRDQTLNQLNDIYKTSATTAQRSFIDSLVTSQSQVRNISQDLVAALESIKDNSADSQILAAITLIQMKVSPVIAVHIPFGGDNHHDAALTNEITQTVTGVQTIVSLMNQLQAAGLQDSVTFMSLNVFGRTLGAASTDGRQHNENHQASITIGKPFRGGVIGGLAPVAGDYGATAIDSASGMSSAGGDIAAVDTLASFGKTIMTAVGVDASVIDTSIRPGKVIAGALA